MKSEKKRLRQYQALLAPGTPLRHGLERILAGRTGALIVLGTNKIVHASCSGGFPIHIPYTPTRLRELAKMDGGIVLSNDLSKILLAGVHVVSDPVPTAETGTRHRSADQLAKVSGVPVVTVSASMSRISLFLGGERHPIEPSEQILLRADQALATMSRYRKRLSAVLQTLTALEVRDQVTLRDVVVVAQRLELMRRLAEELHGYVAALGDNGRLLALQLSELTYGIDDLPKLLAADYSPDGTELAFDRMGELDDADLLEIDATVAALGFDAHFPPEARITTNGYRLLNDVPSLPPELVEKLVERFGGLQGLFGASAADLQTVDGVSQARAHAIRDVLVQLSELAYPTS